MDINDITESFLTKYNKLSKTKLPFIIGIDGLGGAGKTTFVHKLSMDLKNKGMNVITLHIDDFIVESNKRYGTGNEEWYEYYFLQWDIKLLQTELFQKLHCTENVISLPFYDRSSDTVAMREIYIPSQSIVLIEGIFIQRKEWRNYYDFVLFLDCSREERERRVLNRDLYIGDFQKRLDKYERRYWKAEEQYVKMENPLERADIITSGG